MARKFIVIGHIVNDTEPLDHPGGAVAYAGISASYLGADTHILTKCPKGHPYIEFLESKGVHVHRLPSKSNDITTFKNFYNEKGERKQIVLSKQELIQAPDFNNIPTDLFREATILIGTVVGEVDMKLFPELASLGKLAICPQGYFRKVGERGDVSYKEWTGFEKYLPSAQIVILSNEDLTIDGVFQEKILKKLQESSPIIVLTRGDGGATIYEQGKKPMKTYAFELLHSEIKDFTGAGDTYASAFLLFYDQTNDTKLASVISSLYAAVKIASMHGIGMESIPGKLEIALFLESRKNRLHEFLKSNSITTDIKKYIFDNSQ